MQTIACASELCFGVIEIQQIVKTARLAGIEPVDDHRDGVKYAARHRRLSQRCPLLHHVLRVSRVRTTQVRFVNPSYRDYKHGDGAQGGGITGFPPMPSPCAAGEPRGKPVILILRIDAKP